VLDVDEHGPLPAHAELDLRLHLSADQFPLPFGHACRRDRPGDFVAQPGHDARLARSVAGGVPTDDLRKFARGFRRQIIAEDEWRAGGTHDGLHYRVFWKFRKGKDALQRPAHCKKVSRPGVTDLGFMQSRLRVFA
jgi:hypothetical protein